MYTLARNEGRDVTFHSVVLAGVHDVKILKLKLRPDDVRHYNSPWNIAADFTIDLAFSAEEIATMQEDYSRDKNIAMDIPRLSELIHYYTSGYPFLVSKLCYIIDDRIMENNEWMEKDVVSAVKELLIERNTNFDSLIKNLENNESLYHAVYEIVIEGSTKTFNPDNPIIELGVTYGLFKDRGDRLRIHNRIYEQRIYNYMSSILEMSTDFTSYSFRDNFITPDGSLDFEKVLQKFQLFMKEQISEEKRLDIVVTYLDKKYIVKLKVWRGEEAHSRGLHQLSDYLDRQNVDRGYLIIYDLKGKRDWKQEHITTETKKNIRRLGLTTPT